MSFLFHGSMANSPATYLLKGLFPNLSRYLSEKSRYAAKPPTGVTSGIFFAAAQTEPNPDTASAGEQEKPTNGITRVIIKEDPPAKQSDTAQFISPHPLVNFAEVPTMCGEKSNYAVAEHTFETERPIPMLEGVSPSPKSSGVVAGSSSSERSFSTTTQSAPTPQTFPENEAGSSSANGNLNAPIQSRPGSSTDFDSEFQKRLNCHSQPASPFGRSRNVSDSSNETLISSSSNPFFSPSPMICHSNQTRQDAAEKAIRGKQADRIHELEEVVEELGVGLAGQTERAEELQSDLKLCEKDRELNFNTALRLYQDPGSLVRIERRNFIDQIEQLKSNVLICEQDIWSRNQLIEALRYDIALYANQEHWILLRQHYFALQQQYGQMPRDFQRLERKYEDLEDEHINLSDRFKRLEGDHTELKVQHDQIKDERHQLEDDAETSKRSAQEAEARYWALEVQCDHIREQKAKSEKEAGAKERFLADLAARMFKQTMSMARILVGIDIDPMDDEQVALCQLAQKYLGLNANEITNKLAKPESSEDGEVEDERDESNLQATHSENASSSTFVSESNNLESTFPIAEANASSIAAATDGENVPESPAAFATFKAVLQKPFEKGSIISQDLIKSPEDTNEEANDSASVLQDVFNPPRFQDFNFGGSSSAVHFIGNETKPSALPELISEPKPFSIFNISNTSSVQASQSAIDPPRFGQDFAFGSSNGNVSFTANQQTSSNPPASGSEVQSPNASSLPGTSETQDTSSASKIAQAKETTTEEQFPNKDPTENENTKKHAPEIYTPSKTTPKGDNPNKKAQKKKSQKEEEPRKEKPKFDGLNRNQRRAASRERKSAEKKAQAQAETTRHRGRSEVARAMMRGWMR